MRNLGLSQRFCKRVEARWVISSRGLRHVQRRRKLFDESHRSLISSTSSVQHPKKTTSEYLKPTTRLTADVHQDGGRKGWSDIRPEASVLHNRVLHPPWHLQPLRLPLLGTLRNRSRVHHYFYGVRHASGPMRHHRRWIEERWTNILRINKQTNAKENQIVQASDELFCVFSLAVCVCIHATCYVSTCMIAGLVCPSL